MIKVPNFYPFFGCMLLFIFTCSCNEITAFILPAIRKTTAGQNNKAIKYQREFSAFHPFIHGSSTSSPSSSTSTIEQTQNEEIEDPPIFPQSEYDTLIAGGGPTGLMTAIMLSRKFGPEHKIAVCERRSALPPKPTDDTVWNDVARFYLLGIGHRGQSALRKFGIYDDFESASVQVNGRYDWGSGGKTKEDGKITLAKTKTVPTRVLARDKLVGVLYHHILENYADANIDLLYGYEVQPIEGDNAKEKVTVQISKCAEGDRTTNIKKYSYVASQDADDICNVEESTKLTTAHILIGADGSARTIANDMEQRDVERISKTNPLLRPLSEKPFRVTRYEDDNPRVFKSIPIKLPEDWPHDLNYSARSSVRGVTLEALPSDDNGTLCALLLLEPDDELAQSDVDPKVFRELFDSEFPQFSTLISDEEIERTARKAASTLPTFRYVGPRLHDLQTSRTVVIGDAAHTVKPYYGLGANSAFEDVQLLSDAIDDTINKAALNEKEKDYDGTTDLNLGTILPSSIELFSHRRSRDASALVQMSRNMDRRPGKPLFFLNFLIPIILDGIFHKAAPKIFSPNMFGMFQKPGMKFRTIQLKKRFDRTLQVGILGSLIYGIIMGTLYSIRKIILPFLKLSVHYSSKRTKIVAAIATVSAVLLAKVFSSNNASPELNGQK